MATTFNLIAKTELTGGQNVVTFSGLGSFTNYTDLVLMIAGRCNRSNPDYRVWIQFNGSTSGYTSYLLYNSQGSVGAYGPYGSEGNGVAGMYGMPNDGQSNGGVYGNTTVYIPNFASSKNKAFLSDSTGENNGSAIGAGFYGGVWENTSPITSISVNHSNYDWSSGSTFYLYGISNS